MIRYALILLAGLIVYGLATAEETTAGDFGCAGAAVSASCSGAAAPAEVAYRRVGFFERLRARRAERRAARAVYYVPVQAAVGCGGAVAVGCGG